MKWFVWIVGGLALLMTMGPGHAGQETDPMDSMLARVAGGASHEAPALYAALLKAKLYVIAENETAGSRLVFRTYLAAEKKMISVYTSPSQLELDEDSSKGKKVGLDGRELFSLIAQTDCDVALNPFSGHGGQLTSQRIKKLLAE